MKRTAIVLSVFLILFSFSAVYAAKPGSLSSSCVDSDNGVYPNIAGYVNVDGKISTDSCVAGTNQIIERSCSGTTNYQQVACQTGYACKSNSKTVSISPKTYTLAACEPVTCGNSVIDAGETCDSGTSNGITCTAAYGSSCQYCSSNCQLQTISGGKCGDGIVQPTYEQCDKGTANTDTPCIPTPTQNCTYCDTKCITHTMSIAAPVCGNNKIETGETCDDGNIISGDGCSKSCTKESCGNTICDYMLSGSVYVAETATNCPYDCYIQIVNGTSGNDVFQIKYGHVYVNDIDKGIVTTNVVLNGLDGNDTFTTISTSSQTIYGGNGYDSFWVDSTDKIIDASAEETNGPTNSPVSSVHIVNGYFQPNSTNPSSKPSLDANGQNLSDPYEGVPNYGTYIYANILKVYPSLKVFVDEPEYNDIVQGDMGDCYFMATLSSLADTDPLVIKQAVVSLGDTTTAVRFYRSGLPVYLRLDSDFPTYYGSNLANARTGPDNELWVAFMEKAYAEFRTGANSYPSLAAGWMDIVYNQITNRVAYRMTSPSYTDSTLAQLIDTNIKSGYSQSPATYTTSTNPFVKNHAYVIPSTKNTRLPTNIIVFNVWGNDGATYDSNPSDGLLETSMSTFKSQFSTLCYSAT